MPKTDGLTPRRQRFVQEYLIDLNATQAAIRAGYSKKSAQVIGADLIAMPLVAAAISEAQQERAETLGGGVEVFPIPINVNPMVAALVATKMLKPQDRASKKKFAEAVTRAINQWAAEIIANEEFERFMDQTD